MSIHMPTVPHSIGLMNLSQVWAYKSNGFRLMLTLFAIFCTGILPLGLVLYWYRHWWVIASKQQCTLEEAETVIVIDHYKVNFLLVQFATLSPQGLHTTRYVKKVYRQLNEEANMVVPVTGGPGYRTITDFRFIARSKWKIRPFPFYLDQVV